MKDCRPLIYGPVASRRLGSSLGIDLVPPKTCNYDCVYCQLGRTSRKNNTIAPYVKADDILAELKPRLKSGGRPDYITMAGSGEPTLNSELAEIITRVKELSEIPVAVLTNGSLLTNQSVRTACSMADLVLPSLDAADEETFQLVNRPYSGLRLSDVIDGIESFRREYHGTLWLEVMLVEGLNSSKANIERMGRLIERINPDEVQLNTVCRPPAELFALPVTSERVRNIESILQPHAKVIREIPADPGASSEGLAGERELLALIERRPCTRRQIADAFNTNEVEVLKILSRLMTEDRVATDRVGEEVFYRRLPGEIIDQT